MKVLNVLVDNASNRFLINEIVDYLIDAGHNVFLTRDEEYFTKKYTHNIYFLDSGCDILKRIDFSIFTENKATSTECPHLVIIISSNKKASSILSFKESNYLILENHYLEQNYKDSILEFFIDSFIFLSRNALKKCPLYSLSETNLYDSFVKYNDLREKYIYSISKLNEHDSVIKLNITPTIEPKSIRIEAITADMAELIMLYVQYVISGNKLGIYSYDYVNDRGNAITKYVKTDNRLKLDEYHAFFKKELFGLIDDDFFDINLKSGCNVVFSCTEDNNFSNQYLIKFIYKLDNTLTIIYPDSFIFDHLEEIIKKFNHEFDRDKTLVEVYNLTSDMVEALNQNLNKRVIKEVVSSNIVDIFEKQVQYTPEDIAYCYRDIKLSYYDLNAKSNKLARLISEKFTNSAIPIILDRDQNTLVVILAILKSKNHYVPIDSSYPQQRIEYIVNDSNARCVIFSKQYRSLLKDIKVKKICVEDFFMNESKDFSEDNLNHDILENDLAYIIYTSGTTGMPKGVIVTHRGIPNLAQQQSKFFGIKKRTDQKANQQRGLWFSNYVFDAHISEIFTIITTGNQLHIIDNDIKHDFDKLENYIESNSIDIATIPPALLSRDNILNLKTLVIAGDKTDPDIIDKYYDNGIRLVNAYGPTETTVCCTANIYKENGYNNIGKILDSFSARIVDINSFKEVTFGAEGELIVSGIGLAKEYLNNPDLTNEKFIYINEDRYYRTGDFVKLNSNFDIEFIGRIDKQVKINGYRIELKEIEESLREQPYVLNCAVDSIKDKATNFIVAYFISAISVDINDREIRKHLSKCLPEYMIPNLIIKVNEIPLNASGKVDFKELRKNIISLGNDEIVEASTPLENKLVAIWKKVLLVDNIGIFSDFFNLGGNSIAAIKMVSEIRKIGFQCTIKDVFNSRTIKSLISVIRASNEFHVAKLESSKREYAPCTNMQKNIIAASLHSDSRELYNVQVTFEIDINVNIDKFINILKYAYENVAPLRVIFKYNRGDLFQHINHDQNLDLRLINLQETNRTKAQILLDDREEGFTLDKGPLFRVTIIKEQSFYSCVVTNHHSILDGGSIEILFNKIKDILEDKADKSIFDFSVEDYYLNVLKHIEIEKQKNPIDVDELGSYDSLREYNNKKVISKSKKIIELSSVLESKISNICKVNKLSLNSFYLFSWHKLLNLFTQQSSTISGSIFDMRAVNDLSYDSIGLFIEQYPIAFSWSNDISILECLNSFNNKFLDISQERVVSKKKIDNVFIYQDLTSLHELFENIHDEQCLDIPILFEVIRSNNKISFRITYNDFEFSEEMINSIFKYYVNILERTALNINHSHNTLNSILQQDKKIYDLVNMTEKKFEETTVIDEFDKIVKAYPDKLAIVDTKTSITYSELSNKAKALAAKINSLECDFVAILLEREINAIVSMLAVIYAGKAYIPIDVAEPIDRIKHKSKTAGYIISTSKYAQKLQSIEKNIIYIDKIDSETINHSHQFNAKKLNSDNLMYVIYTSGTTGMPKGVGIRHSNVINMLMSVKDILSIDNNVKMTAFTSFIFDVSIYEIFSALLSGAELHLLDEILKTDVNALSEYVQTNNVSHLYIPPALLTLFPKVDYPNLEYIVYAGEPAEKETVNYFSKRHKILNFYGPTETTVFSTYKHINNNEVHLIGKPIANTKIYILDNKLNQVPIGATGELYISGRGVSVGYLNDKERSSQVFLPNKFDSSSEMLYKTGDMVRLNYDDDIEYLGRRDLQVKIRGFRVQLEEIENETRKYNLISNCVAIVNKDFNRDLLVIYYIAKQDICFNDLKKFLSKKLPNYMIPDYIQRINHIPLTICGKIDKKTLPKLDLNRENIIKEERNSKEEKIHLVLLAQLNIKDFSIDDDFFSLGLNSIDTITVVAKLRHLFEIDLDFADIYQYSTVRSLAKFIRNKQINISIDPTKTTLIFLHTARGSSEVYSGLFEQLNKDSRYNLIPVNSHNLSLFENKDYIYNIDELVEFYKEQVKNYCQLSTKVIFIGYSFGGILAYKILSKFKSMKNIKLILLDTFTPNLINEINKNLDRGVTDIMDSLYTSTLQKEVGAIHDKMYQVAFIKPLSVKTLLFKAIEQESFLMGNKPLNKILEQGIYNGWQHYISEKNIKVNKINSSHELLLESVNLKNICDEIHKFEESN